MLETLTTFLAIPIAKAVLEKFYESFGDKLGEKAADLIPNKITELGQRVWQKCLRGKPGTQEMLEKAAQGSAAEQAQLKDYLHKVLDSDRPFREELQPLATEIFQVIQNNVDAKNVQQVFGGQGILITEKQDQPIIQIQGNPTLNFGSQSKD